MSQLLITGFTPFDGRSVNGSWIAAQTYAGANHLEIPVVWGEPQGKLRGAIEALSPEIILSLGEGREGWFDIETRARNERKHRADNHYQYPPGPILNNGPDAYRASVDSTSLHKMMADQNIPIRISTDAGQFICEETLYCLEHLKREYACLKTVVFVHLPPYGTRLPYRGTEREVDTELLKDFIQRLVSALLTVANPAHVPAAKNANIASHQSENSG